LIMIEGKGAMDMLIDQKPILLPGGWQSTTNTDYTGGQWVSINLIVTSMSDGFMSGNVSLNENDWGTFTMAKGTFGN
ncbi:MAG: hypothetical protein QW112_03965, partial [Candidatus Micrarchaeia archaeon]